MHALPAVDAAAPAWELSNEFARVRLQVDLQGQSPRLRIDDLRHDRTVWLDAFQLAALAGLDEATLLAHLDPGHVPP